MYDNQYLDTTVYPNGSGFSLHASSWIRSQTVAREKRIRLIQVISKNMVTAVWNRFTGLRADRLPDQGQVKT